ncbi:MAG: hypothetical protein JRE40_02395 [Deltaproteobacteria bacterium]|nr:hypothetical protein [Deltaproteobacteria bacterium]
MLQKIQANSEAEAKKETIRISKENPRKYVFIVPCFGVYVSINFRLHVNAPCDCPFDWYVLNGKVKNFTDAQHGADQRATPAMS